MSNDVDRADDRMVVQLTLSDLRSMVREEVARAFGSMPPKREVVEKKYVTAAEAASYFSVSPKTIMKWVGKGAPHTFLGERTKRARLVRFELTRLIEWATAAGPSCLEVAAASLDRRLRNAAD